MCLLVVVTKGRKAQTSIFFTIKKLNYANE